METTILLLTTTLLVIACAAVIAPKLHVAAPLLLVMAGIGVSFVPGTEHIVIDPHMILLGLLPPLLYASAMAVPTMNFRRELPAIGGLSVVLVLLSSLALGGAFTLLIPGLEFGWGVALGAILSPTDAVATSIIKGRGVPSRVGVVLDGEGLLNDASALIVLRTAVIATAAGFSFWPALGSFAVSVLVASITGIIAGHLNLAIRRRVSDEAVNTILSFTTPFAAAIPAEMFHGSGLVAAVVAGLVTNVRAPRALPPGHRMSDAQNWATVEIVLEGLVFLTMGLQLSTIVEQLSTEALGIGRGTMIAGIALLIAIAVRAAYVGPLLWRLSRRARHWQKKLEPRLETIRKDLNEGHLPAEIKTGWVVRLFGEGALRRLLVHFRRRLADFDYLARQPLGRPESVVVIWAGMRGAVTVAAAQLLPANTPHRPLLVFIAFAVATMSLLLQGGTMGLLIASLFPARSAASSQHAEVADRQRIRSLLADVCTRVERPDGISEEAHRLALLTSQRAALLDARDDGLFDAEMLERALFDVDVDQLVLELRWEPAQ